MKLAGVAALLAALLPAAPAAATALVPAVPAPAAHPRGVGGVHDGVRPLLGDVASYQSDVHLTETARTGPRFANVRAITP
ncbi:hypothetical protein, partial [Nonomuraea zeae]|uniref:hypothetical protein n=1 Tax=Nonomuraea zeae TaxID=1642303 RepID=UPI00197FC28B